MRDFLVGRMIRSYLQERKRQVVTKVVFVKKVPSKEGQDSDQEFIQCKYVHGRSWTQRIMDLYLSEWK